MNNKLNNMLQEFFSDSKNNNNLEEMNKKLQEFIKQYNAGEIEYTNTLLDDANEILEKAQNTKSTKQAIKLADEAYAKCPDCFDAIVFKADLVDDTIKRREILDDGLKREKERLTKEDYFKNGNMGSFYGIFETRPYIKGLNHKAFYLAFDGKYKLSIEQCKNVLKLNNHDNTGIRYLLMALYASLEDEKSMLDLYHKYQEKDLMMLIPLMILYYKKEEYNKSLDYLHEIEKINPSFIKYIKNPSIMLDKDENVEGYYQSDGLSEVITYYSNFDFLMDSVPNISDFILKNQTK